MLIKFIVISAIVVLHTVVLVPAMVLLCLQLILHMFMMFLDAGHLLVVRFVFWEVDLGLERSG